MSQAQLPLSGSTPPPVYDSARMRVLLLDELRELLRYRDLLWQLVARNIKTRYKRSLIGVAWTMLNPLLMMVVISVVFSGLFRAFGIEHYPVYVLSGLVIWNFYAQTTTAAMADLIWGGTLLNRIYVPRAVFAVSAVGTGLFNLLVAFVPLLLITFILGVWPTPAILFLPFAVVIVAVFTLGLSLALSALAVFFPDVVETYQVVLMAWMYLTPIFYPPSIVPTEWDWLLLINPIHWMLPLVRDPLIAGTLPPLLNVSVSAAIAGLALLLGWWLFARGVDDYAYHL